MRSGTADDHAEQRSPTHRSWAIRIALAACVLALVGHCVGTRLAAGRRKPVAGDHVGDAKQLLRRAVAAEKDPAARRKLEQALRVLTPRARETASTVRVAAIQFISKMGDPELNRKGLERHIRRAAANGARIVVVPETAITGYMSTDLKTTWQVGDRGLSSGLQGRSPAGPAETVPGPSTRAFAGLSRELGIYLTVPFLEVDPETGNYYNTLCLVGPDGKLLLHYRKLNPWPFAEKGWATKGDRGLMTVDTPFGRLGLLICYDINYEPPNLRKMGVDTLLYSIAWVDDRRSTWFFKELPRIARRNNMNIIGANWSVPEHTDWYGYGKTLIISRTGRVLARVASDFGDEIIYADLPLPKAAAATVAGQHPK